MPNPSLGTKVVKLLFLCWTLPPIGNKSPKPKRNIKFSPLNFLKKRKKKSEPVLYIQAHLIGCKLENNIFLTMVSTPALFGPKLVVLTTIFGLGFTYWMRTLQSIGIKDLVTTYIDCNIPHPEVSFVIK